MRPPAESTPTPAQGLWGMAEAAGLPWGAETGSLWRSLALTLNRGDGTPAFRRAIVTELAGLARRTGDEILARAWEAEAEALEAGR